MLYFKLCVCWWCFIENYLVLLSFQGSLIIKPNQSCWKSVLSLPHCRVFSLVSLALISSLKEWLRELNLTKMLLLYCLMVILHSGKKPPSLGLSTQPKYWSSQVLSTQFLHSFTPRNMSILRPFTEPSVCTKGWQWDIAALKSTGESCPLMFLHSLVVAAELCAQGGEPVSPGGCVAQRLSQQSQAVWNDPLHVYVAGIPGGAWECLWCQMIVSLGE